MVEQEVCPPAERRAETPLWRRLLALGVALTITALVIAFRKDLAHLGAYGYLGVFVLSLVSNATIILPVPGFLGTFAAGSAFNPLLVGVVAGLAEPIGELTGYLAGYAGRATVENQKLYTRLLGYMQGHHYLSGYLIIFVLAAIPNPVFDLAGIAAGALRLPVAGFLVSCWLGKTLKAIAVAYAGAFSIGFLGNFLTQP